ncbi:MAG: tetratricopeptide repeat protein [Verrucomicrobiales bacterium]|nr:tetratricopeptide repeat protein [Verrucomicrobiales bacterium]
MELDSKFTPGDEAKVNRWIEHGQTNTAWEWFSSISTPEKATSRIGRSIAGRLMNIRGACRGADLLHIKNFREYRDDPRALFYGLFRIHEKFGPWKAIWTLKEWLNQQEGSETDPGCAELYSYLADLYATYRDFDRAWKYQQIAESLAPDDCWIKMRRSVIYSAEDNHAAALTEAEAALKMRPAYRAATALLASLYWNSNRDETAISLLTGSLEINDSPGPASQLAHYYDETGDLDKGLEAINIYESRSPMADKYTKEYIANMRAMFYSMKGDKARLIQFGKASGHPFYESVVEKIDKGELDFDIGTRKILPVPFVRQDNLTCAPATLTALCTYWKRPAEHLDVAEEICYDGTPAFKERFWAIENGWHVREFKAGPEVTRALIDAGMPYALGTVEPTSAHLQAVIGYDTRLGTLIIRDPGARHYREVTIEDFFKEYEFSGPRGMVFVPKSRAAELNAIKLPDTELYDIYHDVQASLEDHDRDHAEHGWNDLTTLAPDDRLTRLAEWSLCAYDGDLPRIRDIAIELSEKYPDACKYRLDIFRRNGEFQTREERIEWLRKELAKDQVFTLFFKEIADLLEEDARSLDEAEYYYRRALKFRQTDPETIHGLANLYWGKREFTKATELYRMASCLAPLEEFWADSYFKACRWTNQSETGLIWLKKRFTEYGNKDSGPATTLWKALDILNRDTERDQLLEEALDLRPDDGQLIYFAAQHSIHLGPQRVAELINQAESTVAQGSLLRLKAGYAERELDVSTAINFWHEILQKEPFAMDAYRSVTSLTAESEGVEKAVTWLAGKCAEYPNHIGLLELLVSWKRKLGPGKAADSLRQLIERQPANGWAIRELSIDLAESGNKEEVLEKAKEAVAVQPRASSGHSILGSAYEELLDMEKARQCFQRAIELDVEDNFAMRSLVRVSVDDQAKKDALKLIENQLVTQVLNGSGLSSFQDIAYDILEPVELLTSLQHAHRERPDLWQTWSTLIDQNRAMGQLDEALELATRMTSEFPMTPRAFFDLSQVHRDLHDVDAEIQALEKALDINPLWDVVLRRLADAREKKGQYEEATVLLQKAVKIDPLNPANHGTLADTLWKRGLSDEAFASLLQAIHADPQYGWAWNQIGEWSKIVGRENDAIAAGENLVTNRPFDPDAWIHFSNLYETLGEPERRLEILREGITHCPTSSDIHDLHAFSLCVAGRYNEAIEACSPPAFNGHIPHYLQGRAAWVEAYRNNTEKAIEMIREPLASHSDWLWGYERLHDWYLKTGQLEEATETAGHIVRLRPHSPYSYGNMAELYLEMEKKDEAIESFTKAFKIDPNYIYAGWHLIRLKIEKKDYDDAAGLLETFEYHNPSDSAPAEMRCLYNFSTDQEDKIESFEKLMLCDDISEEALLRVEELMRENDLGSQIYPTYKKIIESGKGQNPNTAARWAAFQIYFSVPELEEILHRVSLKPETNYSAWREAVLELCAAERHRDAIGLIKRNQAVFTADSGLWAIAGHTYRLAKKDKHTVTWMSDWKEREDIRPWMMLNLTNALFMTRGIQAAGPVFKYSADQLPPDHDSFAHHVGAAYFEAANSNFEEAERHLAEADSGVLNEYFQHFYHLAQYRYEFQKNGRVNVEFLKSATEAYPGLLDHSISRKLWVATVKPTFWQLMNPANRGIRFALKSIDAILRNLTSF